MAHLTRSRRGELLKGVFAVLRRSSDGMQARDVLAALEQLVPPTPYEEGRYPSGVRRFEKVVRFQTVNAVKAGWLTKDKGLWTATEEGLAADAAHPDPAQFMEQAEALYAAWARRQASSPTVAASVKDGGMAEEEGLDEEDTSSITLETAIETAFAEITEYLNVMPPYAFQKLVAGLLRGMGYHVSWDAPPGPDGGVDVIAFSDPLGTEDPRIKVQVKREPSRKTDVVGLRAFMSVLNRGDVGVFVSLGGFTSSATAEARNSETRRITLVDTSDLFDLWVLHYAEIPESARRLLPLRPVYYLDRRDLGD
jgi:restriction system protein